MSSKPSAASSRLFGSRSFLANPLHGATSGIGRPALIKLVILLPVVSDTDAVAGMFGALILTLLVSAFSANLFLFLIGLFSGYVVLTGWRVARVRDGTKSTFDQLASQLMVTIAIVVPVLLVLLFKALLA